MARIWKEPYTLDKAFEVGIRDFENVRVVDAEIPPRMGSTGARPQWIYFVTVCGFTFAFFSIGMIREYLDFYSRKILPSSRFGGISPFSNGAATSVGDGQARFERLPLRLRRESKRVQVVKALERALKAFGADE